MSRQSSISNKVKLLAIGSDLKWLSELTQYFADCFGISSEVVSIENISFEQLESFHEEPEVALIVTNAKISIESIIRDIRKISPLVEIIILNDEKNDVDKMSLNFNYFGSYLRSIEPDKLALEILSATLKSRESRAGKLILEINNLLLAVIASRKGLNEILQIACKSCVELFGVEHCAIAWFEKDYSFGKAIAEYSNRKEWETSRTIGTVFPVRGVSQEEKLVFEKQIIKISDLTKERGFEAISNILQPFGIRSMLIAPIVLKGEVVASISIDSKVEKEFSQVDKYLLAGLSNLAAVAIENTQLIDESQQRADDLERLLASVPAGFVAVDLEGRVTKIDVNAQEILGYSEEDVLGKFVGFLYADPNTPYEVGELLKNSINGKIERYQTKIKAKRNGNDGKSDELPILLSASWVYDKDKKIVGSSGYFDLRKTEMALMKAQKAARVIAGSLAQGDTKGTLREVATGILEASGCDIVTLYEYDDEGQQLLSPPVWAGDLYYPSKLLITGITVRANSIVSKMFVKGKLSEILDVTLDENFSRTRFAREEEVSSCVVVPLSAAGAKVGIIFVNFRKKYKLSTEVLETLQLFADQAAAAIRLSKLYGQLVYQSAKRKEFMQDVTHQLVGPLAGLRAHCANLLNGRVAPERGRVLLETILEQAGHLQRYAENFAYAARGEKSIFDKSEYAPIGFTREDLIGLLIKCSKSFQGEAKRKDLHGPSVKELTFKQFPILHIVPDLFEIVILNLLDNSVKYSYESAPITISGLVMDSEVEIHVVSHGIPLSEDDIKQIFHRYIRMSKAIQAAPVGTGIGLFLCKEIMRMHGGGIRALPSSRSIYGNEVKFILTLPTHSNILS